jgi:exopolyphosphatase/guanosine-5'-triphosphate,3'-diphosphate pyrophosphatase
MATSGVIGHHHGNLARSTMLCACIDIGTNTTRVLVADVRDGVLRPLAEQRAFTRTGRSLTPEGRIPDGAADALVAAVAEQRARAEAAGAVRTRAVATAVLREASNRADVVERLRREAGVEVRVLSGVDEARLAFLGATRTLGEPLPGRVGVVDVGGGSTEIALGRLRDGADWSATFPVGSSHLADRAGCSDPPTARDIAAMRAQAQAAFAALDVPRPDCAVAVGGSAASLRRVVGAVLDEAALERALAALAAGPATAVARSLGLEPERIRLLPAGILVLDAAARRLGRPLRIGRGGLREGVLLELAAGEAA